MNLAGYWKAAVAFVAPGATLVIAAVTEGSQGGSTITSAEWITAAATCVVSSGLVAAAPANKPAAPAPAPDPGPPHVDYPGGN